MKILKIESVGRHPVYDISVEDEQRYVLDNGCVSHNSGPELASDTILFVSKAKEKEGKELVGFHFNLRVNKSRFVKEGSVFPLHVTFEEGICKYSGLFEFAKENGFIDSPSQGWYTRPFVENDKKWRMKEIDETPEFWDAVLTPEFKAAYEQKYLL